MTGEMLRYSDGKPRLSYFPSSFWRVLIDNRSDDLNLDLIKDICAVLDFGARKYSKDNWRASGSWCKCVDSALRHLVLYINGETHDQESGMPHLAHLGCNLVFLIEFQQAGTGQDDRYKPAVPSKVEPLKEYENCAELLLQLITRWLECEHDGYIEDALLVLNDMYGESDNDAA